MKIALFVLIIVAILGDNAIADDITMTGTKIGDPVNRMQVPVANGDIIAFVVEAGTHHVLFENATREQAGGTWEVVKDSGTLEKLPDGKLPAFNHDDALCSTAGTGALIKIRILKLESGKSILFACNPHSSKTTDVVMVGAIVSK